MKLSAELQTIVDEATGAKATPAIARRAIGLLDLTSLNDDDTGDVVEALCRRAVTPAGPVAAVCVWPRFVAGARRALDGTGVRIATVVNFPGGADDTATVAKDTRDAVADGADEIDVVLPYRAFIDGARSQPQALLRACFDACGERALMKVILEAGQFPTADLLSWASRDAIAAGAAFLKTSTGKTQPAATLPTTALLLDAAHDAGRPVGVPVGVKAAGGIRDADTAAAYLHLADAIMGEGWATPRTFRFGASGLLDSLLAVVAGKPAGAAEGAAPY
ncbi:deoxyribose-phosphate aldolase [Azospirillum sp. RWY-5-1]|uniref:Deoxyribose-phosphate aldolase n=1 Tax=Azospirillum oleiclasticum TaxID=2735135 RepID=A0ABX2TKC1_9PROT|nr:deoxyribose-phosphate aldolase [Azospirillum oleiclasticum]NYZ17429.1 deoxyribose-phosphate aldolase [Azospirillum oleiclasticum]NYZ24806.1 deoxyribose-phosphate aldolase [Azospirillum oleiclasticum]